RLHPADAFLQLAHRLASRLLAGRDGCAGGRHSPIFEHTFEYVNCLRHPGEAKSDGLAIEQKRHRLRVCSTGAVLARGTEHPPAVEREAEGRSEGEADDI